jgi:hypothetical protein
MHIAIFRDRGTTAEYMSQLLQHHVELTWVDMLILNKLKVGYDLISEFCF